MQLVHVYRYERATYLVITIVSTVLFLGSVAYLLFQRALDTKTFLGLFGSTGGVTASVGMSLKMWNDSLKRVFG